MENNDILSNFKKNEPASEAAIVTVESAIGFEFPDGYRRFLLSSNGGEGDLGSNGYAILWRVEELQLLNDSYEVDIYAPGFFIFGSDGGGEAFAFDLTMSPVQFVSIPFVGLNRSLARPIGTNFDLFIKTISS